MSIRLKEHETMEDVVRQLGFASEWVYEIAPIAYWYENLHENGRIRDIHFSRRMREMLGYHSEEEFPDDLNTLMTFTHPDDIHLMLDDAIAAGTGKIDKYDVQYRIRTADGSYKWCNATGEQIRDHNGVIVGMYGAFIDISREIALKQEQEDRERDRLNRELAAAREEALRNEMLYDVSKTEKWAYQISADDEVRVAGSPENALNKLGEGLTGTALEWMSFLHPEDQERVTGEFMAAIRDHSGNTPYRTTFRLLGQNGEYLWFRSAGRVICNGDGTRDFIGLSTEVSEQIAEQQKMETARQALNEALQDDGVFLIDCVQDQRKTIHDRLSGADKYEDTEPYSTAFTRYVDNFVCEPDREMMRGFADPRALPGILGDKKELRVQYRDRTTGIQRFYEMKLVRFSDTEVLQSFRETDAEMLNNLLFDQLKENYFALIGVDLESGLVRSYKTDPKNIVGEEGKVSPLSSVMSALSSHFAGDTKQFFERNSDPDYIREKFANTDKATYVFRSALGDRSRWAEITGIVLQRNAKGIPSLFCLAFSYLDEEASRVQDMQEELNAEVRHNELVFETFNAERWTFDLDNAGVEPEEGYSGTSGNALELLKKIHPDDRAAVREKFVAAALDPAGKTPYEADFRVVGKDGEIRWIKSAGRVLRHRDGTGELFGMNVDITDEVRAQENYLAQKAVADQFMSHFLRDYGTVFKVNIDDYSCTLLKKDEQMRTKELDYNDFSVAVEYFLTHVVYEADRERVRREMDPQLLKRELAENATYSIEYRVDADGVVRWDEMKVSALDDTYVAVGFAIRNREIILRHLQEKEDENYYALFAIDLDAEQITMLKNDSGYATGEVGSSVPYGMAMKHFAESLEGEAKEFFRKMSDIEQVRQVHADEDKLTYVYQSVLDEKKRWIRATSYAIIRHEDGSPAVATLGFNLMDSMSTERQEMQEKLAQMTAVFNYFIKSYSSAYYINLKNGNMTLLQSSPYLDARLAGKRELDFDRFRAGLMNDFVHPDDQEQISRFLQPDSISRRLETADEFSFSFRTVAPQKTGIYRCTVIRGADDEHVGIGFRSITDEVRKEQEIQRVDSLVKSFASEYEAVFIVSLEDGSYRTVSESPEIGRIFDGKGTFMSALDQFTRELMYPPDRERAMKERISPDQVAEKLPVGQTHTVEFRRVTDDGYTWYRGTLNRISEDTALFGFKDINEEKLYNMIEEKIIGEFDAIYLVNLDEDTIRPVRASRISHVGDFRQKLPYSQVAIDFSETVGREYKADWIRFSDPMYMKHYLADLDRREYIYELPEAGNAMRRLTMDVVERIGGEPVRLLFTFTGIDDLRAQSMQMEKQMAEQSAFTRYFLESYVSAYYIGLRDLSWQAYKRTDRLEKAYPDHENYVASFGRYIRTEVHPEDRKQLYVLIEPDRLKARLSEQASFSVSFRKIPEGTILRCDVIRGADADHAAFGFRDVTEETAEQERRQHEMEEMLESAQAASKAKSNFLFNMSHDIRTPMNAIIGFTNMALKYMDDRDRVTDSLHKTQEASELLLSLINDILDMSRIEAGKIHPEENEGDVCLSFAQIESTMREMAGAKELDLSFSFGKIRDQYVYADFSRCARVFVNIITNAIKYTNPGGYVRVKCEELTGTEALQALPHWKKTGYGIYRYTFEDNGIGMSEDFRKHVFDEFTRENTATVSGIQGTGLGLAVCRTLVTAMNGTIDCVSRQGEGSTFTVTLLFRIREGELFTDPVNGQAVSAGTAPAEGSPVDFTGRRVLLVEDNAMNREIAEDILSEEGLTVETAQDGSVAVHILKEKGPDAFDFILMDIQMPIMDGYEATRAIREMYPKAGLPIIALSANAFEEDRIASAAAGMNDHIAKPINIKDLFEVLARYLK